MFQYLYKKNCSFSFCLKVVYLIIGITLLHPNAVLYAQEIKPNEDNVIAKPFKGDLSEILERRVVRILVPYSKTGFSFDDGEYRGLQADAIKEFEKLINENRTKSQAPIFVAVLPVNFNQLLPLLLAGKGDIAAGLITLTPERLAKVDFASGRKVVVDELLVTSKNTPTLTSLEQYAGKTVYVLSGSSYLSNLTSINAQLRLSGVDEINIVEADPNLATEDILEMVNAGIIDATVVDNYKADLWAQVLPNIVVHQNIKINSGGSVGWAIRKESPELAALLEVFISRVKKGTLLGNIFLKRHYKNTDWIKNPTNEEERKKFTELTSIFSHYADEYDFDYLALAAQAFQESRFDHTSISSAGAIGIMQLLPSTAADPNVDIANIDILENNIHAGAKYMSFLRSRYFSDDDISKQDRFAFTWAAYNAGPAKVRKLRNKAKEMGLNPNKWFHNVEYAALEVVGLETVRYVANIYKYYIAYKLSRDISVSK